MKLPIHPYSGIGPLQFGMSVDEVRRILGDTPKPFTKTKKSSTSIDAFPRLGIHVYYKESGACNAIELMEPAEPSFNGELLTGKPFNKIRALFEAGDKTLKVDESGFTSLECGIGIYCPAARDDSHAPVEGVIIFEKGYYG